MIEENNQIITLKNRSSLEANSIIDVEGFDEEYMVVNTKKGKLCIEGHGLKMNDLSGAEGKITVSGEITALFFKDETGKKRGLKK